MNSRGITILDVERWRVDFSMSHAEAAKAMGLSAARVYNAALSKAEREGAKPLAAALAEKAAAAFGMPAIIVAPPLAEKAVSNGAKKPRRQRKPKPAVNGAEKPPQCDGAGGGLALPPEEPQRASEAPSPVTDDAELDAIEAANRATAWGAAGLTTGTIEEIARKIDDLVPEEKQGKKLPADERLAAIKKLHPLLMAAHKVGMTTADRAVIQQSISSMLGVPAKAAKDLIDGAAVAVAAEMAKTPEQTALEVEAERLARRAELWAKVEKLATDPNLMQHVVDYAQSAGVVGEEAGILGLYLTATSRLSAKKALSLLRRGAPASGKNFAADIVLAMFPPEDLINLTGASPKALHYFGGADNPEALKHKILYLAEAAAIARQGGDEHEMTKALRTLIQEGYINYAFVDFDSKETVETKKEGPTALVMTSARANVEEELLTRLVVADTDESPEMTRRVIAQILAKAGDNSPGESTHTRDEMIDFQRWLAAGGPYDVVIPFANALHAAMHDLPSPLRARRDVTNTIGGIAACAIIHAAQRKRDGDGRIIAEINDYTWTYRAFAEGLASIYAPKADKGVVALVAALERLLEKANAPHRAALDEWKEQNPKVVPGSDEFKTKAPPLLDAVQASHNQIKAELGIASNDAVSARITSAFAAELIEIVDTTFSGKRARGRAPNTYRINVSSEALTRQRAELPALPTPEAVQDMLDHPEKQDPDYPF